MATILAQATIPSHGHDKLQLAEVYDGTYIVGFKKDLEADPDLCVGIIGPWLNTDDLETAESYYQDSVKHERLVVN